MDKFKIFIGAAYGERIAKNFYVTGKPFLGEPNTCCSETYMVIGPVLDELEALNIMTYMSTKFFRFLVLLLKSTQHAPKKVYSLVPLQDFSEPWTDEKLYAKYALTVDEIAFIESMIRPMDLGGSGDE